MNTTKKVMLCAISNISSGTCAEDCSFCAQSAKYKASIDRYAKKPIETIVAEATAARANKASGFCLVTAGKGLDDTKLEFVAQAARAVRDAHPEINIIACNGTATKEQLAYLKEAGVNSYNHNLETSQRFYQTICSTHTWEERYETCQNAKSVGLKLCTGGIYGLGETQDDRLSMLQAVASLQADSSPINFYIPNDALPLQPQPMSPQEALEIIALARSILPQTRLMIAGGRSQVFGDDFLPVLEAGAQAIVIGNYLTTLGNDPVKEHAILAQGGYEIIERCREE